MSDTATIDTQNDALPTDFAEAALRSMTDDPAAPAPQQADAPKPETTKSAIERPKGIPESLQPKKEEAPKTDAEPESEIAKLTKPEFKDPKRAAQWDALHGKASEFEKQFRTEAKARADADAKVTAMEARIAEAEKAGKNTEAMEAKLAEYEAILEKVSVESRPEFRAKYITGRADKVKEIQAIIADAGGDPADVATALALKGRERVDALRLVSDDLPGYMQGLLGTAIRELDSLDREADHKRANSAEYIATQEREDQQRQQQEVERDVRESELGWQRAQKKMLAEFAVFNKTGTDKEWDAKADAAVARAEQVFRSNVSREQQAEIIMRAEAAKEIEGLYHGLREYAEKLEKINAEHEAELKKVYGSTSPSLRGGDGGSRGTVGEMDFASRTMHEMNGGAA